MLFFTYLVSICKFVNFQKDHFNRKAVLIRNLDMGEKAKGTTKKTFLAAQLEASFPVIFVKMHRKVTGKEKTGRYRYRYHITTYGKYTYGRYINSYDTNTGSVL